MGAGVGTGVGAGVGAGVVMVPPPQVQHATLAVIPSNALDEP